MTDLRATIIKIVLHILALFPLPITHTLATVLGKLIGKRSRLVRVIQTNIRLCFPHLSESQHSQLVAQSLVETCKTFSELGALWLWPPSKVLKLIQQVSGEEILQHALQQGKGVILLTPHLGAWEMAGLYASCHYPLTALYRPPKLQGLHVLIHRARERAGGRFVPTDQTGVRALYQALRQGHIAGILPDQVPPPGAGIFVPFFGIPTYTMILVSRLAHKTQAPVLFTYAERLSRGFHLHFLPVSEEIACENLNVAVTTLNQGIEQCVNQCVSQYQWSYKRFKSRPLGVDPVYFH